MKGLILALFCFILLTLLSVPILQIYRGKKYFKPVILMLTLSLLIYSVLYYLFPRDLVFLPENLSIENEVVDYSNGFAILTLLAFCFSHMICTAFISGFSYRLLIKISQKEELGVTFEELLEDYGFGSGEDPVFGSRLHNLIRGGYMRKEGSGAFTLLPKGNFFAILVKGIQKSLNMEPGG